MYVIKTSGKDSEGASRNSDVWVTFSHCEVVALDVGVASTPFVFISIAEKDGDERPSSTANFDISSQGKADTKSGACWVGRLGCEGDFMPCDATQIGRTSTPTFFHCFVCVAEPRSSSSLGRAETTEGSLDTDGKPESSIKRFADLTSTLDELQAAELQDEGQARGALPLLRVRSSACAAALAPVREQRRDLHELLHAQRSWPWRDAGGYERWRRIAFCRAERSNSIASCMPFCFAGGRFGCW